MKRTNCWDGGIDKYAVVSGGEITLKSETHCLSLVDAGIKQSTKTVYAVPYRLC